MKKIFIAILGVAAFAACSQEMTLETPKGAAIAFDNAFVNNSTRAAIDLTKGKFDFGVYGTVANASGDALIFTNQTVASDGSYSPAQYWVANATYTFTAYAPKTGAQWTYAPATDTASEAYNGTLSFNNAAALGEQDLLFAAAESTTPATIESAPAAVGLTFGHLLSKVAFKFTNIFTDENISLNVYGVQINNAAAEGTLPVVDGATEDWTGTGDYVRAFGAAEASAAAALANGASLTTEHYYLIPVERAYNITFKVGLYQAGVLLNTYEHTIDAIISLEKGKSYCLNATLAAENVNPESQLFPIEFKVDGVEDWTEDDVTLVAPTKVATVAELKTALAAGQNVVLTADLNLDEDPAVRAAAHTGMLINNDVVIDGAGHTITTSASRGIVVSGAANVVLKNFNLVAGGERGIQAQQNAKKVTIENVTVVAANYAVNLPTSAGATEVTINNCDLKGLNTVNIAAPGAVVNINSTTLRCEDNADESYSVIAVNKDATGAVVTVNGGEIIVTGTKPEGTNGGDVQATNGAINISSTTKGNTTISNRKFAIMYGEYWYSFKTLADAIEKVQNGETIMLTQDATLDTTCSIEKDITLDLNGKTLTIAAKDATVVDLKNYGKMNLINGKIAAGNAEASRRCVYNYGEMTINNVEFVQTYGAKGAAINNEAKMTIENATVNSVYYAIWNSGANAELVVNGGTFNCVGNNDTWKPSNDSVAWCYAVINRNGAKMTVNGGYFSGNHGVIAASEGSVVTLNAGTYECFATMSGISDWVLYAYGDGAAVKYSANCVLKHATKAADACCTTENNGVVAQF